MNKQGVEFLYFMDNKLLVCQPIIQLHNHPLTLPPSLLI